VLVRPGEVEGVLRGVLVALGGRVSVLRWGVVPCTMVMLPPSIKVQPRLLATSALFVYSLPQR
jgi:hypothetical protein